MVNVKELVANKLVESAPAVRGRVLDLLVGQEQEKRVKAVVKVISDLDEARKTGAKIKPDASTFDRDGKVVSEAYTKATTELVKKNKELVARLETALNEALDEQTPNFDKLLKISGGEKGGSKDEGEGSE